MNTTKANQARAGKNAASDVFADPVAYLASLGIESELVEVRLLPAAA